MINFFKYSRIFLFISFLLIFGSFVSIYFKGFNYGIDFKGGTLVQIFYDEKDGIDQRKINLLKQNFEKQLEKLKSLIGAENVVEHKGTEVVENKLDATKNKCEVKYKKVGSDEVVTQDFDLMTNNQNTGYCLTNK